VRYVALGDSYTIGTSVTTAERWPDQLVAALGPAEPSLDLVANLGVNGYTTADLIRDELPALDDLRPGFASVLIGVNDVVRGVAPAAYAANVATILDALLARLPATRILTVAIPDYTVTPAGADYGDPRRQHDGIVAANETMASLAADRGIAYVDTYDLSLRAAVDRSLVAADGLHPSGAQYALWVERIAPVVEALIGR
jgi:lysophospholipase L1-like esterase